LIVGRLLDMLDDHALLAREDRATFGLPITREDELAVTGCSQISLRFGDEHFRMRAS